ncbi:MAG TPA: PRC-barrel domain-containing protein [Cyclobacteriaceae bacterium]|jgi:sporulation protein YlmC with PRC-barrel domain|nr:PRC-barrel domain-containing protein [Cyclobacteriaceae bacterium]
MNIFTKENLTGKNQTGKMPNLPLRYLTASTLIGEKVINDAEEKLGDVKDIMIDIVDGKIHYVVIEMGGFLGMGEKYFAIPFDMLQISTDEHAFILNQEKEKLKNAPGFDKDHWPDTNAHYAESGEYWGNFMGQNTGAVPY